MKKIQNTKTALALAVLLGMTVSLGSNLLFAMSWPMIQTIGVIYTSVGYFYFSSETSISDVDISFDNRIDQLGYAIGSFGVVISPVAVVRYNTGTDSSLLFLIWFVGLVSYFHLASAKSCHNSDSA